jgi:hypothetical protein
MRRRVGGATALTVNRTTSFDPADKPAGRQCIFALSDSETPEFAGADRRRDLNLD